jgi:secreted trypsin-like serine protease
MKVLFAFAALLAATTPAFAITGDWIEDTVHPYVGLVVFYNAQGSFIWRCSGSLISPTKLVTAGHCADTAEGAASARVYFQQDAGANFNPATGKDPITGYPEECAAGTLGTLCATSSSIHNYGFANFAGFPNTHDVGVVILDQPIALPKYGLLPQAGTLDNLAARGAKNTLFTVSGYGLALRVNAKTVHSKLSNISFRERLMAQSSLVNLGSAYTDGYNLQTQGNGNSRGGTCSGDSGGPVFLGGASSNLIVAVTSFGLNELCRGTDYGYRIDRQEVLDWINSQ